MWAVEREAIEAAVRHCDGSVQRAAAALAISASTIYRKKAQWESKGLKSPDLPRTKLTG